MLEGATFESSTVTSMADLDTWVLRPPFQDYNSTVCGIVGDDYLVVVVVEGRACRKQSIYYPFLVIERQMDRDERLWVESRQEGFGLIAIHAVVGPLTEENQGNGCVVLDRVGEEKQAEEKAKTGKGVAGQALHYELRSSLELARQPYRIRGGKKENRAQACRPRTV